MVLGEGQAGQSESFRALNNSGGLWPTGIVSSCLVPGPGRIRDGTLLGEKG